MASYASSPPMTGSLVVAPMVLVIGDEAPMRRFLVSALSRNGIRTMHVGTRAMTRPRAVVHESDLVLVDLSQPGVDRVGMILRLREWTGSPILVVLAAPAQRERGAVLDAGATDYILTPIATAELLARIRVCVRQAERLGRSGPLAQPLGSDRLRIDRDHRSLVVDGHEVHITPLECKLLLALVHSPGNFMTEEQILAAVWRPEATPQVQYLRAQVRQLRQKIERDPARPRHLVTESGGGYRLKLG
jgi:two-component system KDP operon response regulator KdpE